MMKASISPIYTTQYNTGKQLEQGDDHHIAVSKTSSESKKQSSRDMSLKKIPRTLIRYF